VRTTTMIANNRNSLVPWPPIARPIARPTARPTAPPTAPERRASQEPEILNAAPQFNRARRCMSVPATMRRVLIASVVTMAFGGGPVAAQIDDTVSGIGTTSPPGMTGATTVPPTGNAMGATELPSPGLSPLPAGSPGAIGGAACPVQPTSSSGMSGSGTTFDGGGMALGMPLPGSTANCGTSPTTGTASPSAMSTPSPGGASPVGIPLGSVETGDAGLSPMPVSPVPNPMPLAVGSAPYSSMVPTSSAPMVSAPNPFTPAVGVGGPCAATGSTVSSSSPTGC
jgi:hypothetical protein